MAYLFSTAFAGGASIACPCCSPQIPLVDPDTAWAVARLEAHYFRNAKWEPDGMLLDRVDRIRHRPIRPGCLGPGGELGVVPDWLFVKRSLDTQGKKRLS